MTREYKKMCKICKHKHDSMEINEKGYCLHCVEELYWLAKQAEEEFGVKLEGK